MTIQEAVAPRVSMFAKRLTLFGAIVANKWSSDYLDSQVVKEEPALDEYVLVEQPGRRTAFSYL